VTQQPSKPSEKDLFDKIAFRHDVLKEGFRKLSSELRSEGIDINKDKAFRIYRKYSDSSKAEEITDDELKLLIHDEKDREGQVSLAKAKREKRERIASLLIQKAELDLNYRIRIFQNDKMLFDFSKSVLPVQKPGLWLEFTAFCAAKKIRPAKILREVLGDQVTYEETRYELAKEGRIYFLDKYLDLRLSDWLLSQRPEEAKEEEREQTKEEGSEAGSEEWLDEEGYWNILLPRASGDNESSVV